MAALIPTLSLLVTGLLTGNELAVALFIHPVLYRVPDPAHATVVKPLAAKLGRSMPFWYVLSLILAILQTILARRAHLPAWHLACAACALMALIIVLTILLAVPINNRIAQLDSARPPANWLNLRRRWDLYHSIRVLLLILVDVLLIRAALMA
jgi:hypothetical protein